MLVASNRKRCSFSRKLSFARCCSVRSRVILTKPRLASLSGINSPEDQKREPSFRWCHRSSIPRPNVRASHRSLLVAPLFAILFRQNHIGRTPEDLLGRVAKEALCPNIPAGRRAMRVHRKNGEVGGALDDELQQLFLARALRFVLFLSHSHQSSWSCEPAFDAGKSVRCHSGSKPSWPSLVPARSSLVRPPFIETC